MVIEAPRTQESAIQELGGRIGNWIERQFEEGKLGGIKVADLLKLGFLGAGVLASLISHIQSDLPENSSDIAGLLDQYGREGSQAKMVVRLERKWSTTITEEQGRNKKERSGPLHGSGEIAIVIGMKTSEREKQNGAFDRALVALRMTPVEKLPRLVVAVTTKQGIPAINRPATEKDLGHFAYLMQESRDLLEEI